LKITSPRMPAAQARNTAGQPSSLLGCHQLFPQFSQAVCGDHAQGRWRRPPYGDPAAGALCALSVLRDEGLIVAMPGRGTFVKRGTGS